MKLLNYTTSYFAGILLVVITIWAGLFYYNMLDEIYDSMDDGLGNQKLLVIKKAALDSTVLSHQSFDEGYYAIKKIPFEQAENQRDVYQDTLMYMLNEEDFEPVRMLKTVFRQKDNYYEMRVITSMVEEDDLIEDLLYSLLWLYLGLIASILVLNNVLLKKIWQPFYSLLHYLQSFRLGDAKEINLQQTKIDEFQLLNNTIQKLLQSNTDTYISQKNFIENASHELQTPLAISLNKLELLAESSQLQDEQLMQIGAVMENLERLTRLNKSLLLLSKIENKQFAPAEEVNINAVLKKVTDDFADQAAFSGITISLEEEATCNVKMNPDLTNILLVNLIKNAIIHNQEGGFVNINIKEESLVIQNSGKETPLDQQKIFTRFYKDNSSPSSTGLGLAIVKAIADLYQFKLTYDYQQKHIWTVIFKKPV